MASRKGPGLGFWQASAAGTCALSHPHTCQIFGKTKQNKKPQSPHLPGPHFPHLSKEEVEQDQEFFTRP